MEDFLSGFSESVDVNREKAGEFLDERTIREIERSVEMENAKVQAAVWTRVARTLRTMSDDFKEPERKALVDHTLGMMAGGPNFQVIPRQSWIYPDGHRREGDFYMFARGPVYFGEVMLKYAYDVQAEKPYCLIDHIQGIQQDEYPDPKSFFGVNVLEGMAAYVIEKSRGLLDDGWWLALKSETLPMSRMSAPYSMGVKDRFFDPKPREVELKSATLPGIALKTDIYDLNPNRKRVKEILGS
ncbi:MAG: hypothetical protein NTZ25_04090 [Candidatus Peregrinibacteria bacterium]|nr:hypothetical protein [Candidatus Peregrinibacteria bacterium]